MYAHYKHKIKLIIHIINLGRYTVYILLCINCPIPMGKTTIIMVESYTVMRRT